MPNYVYVSRPVEVEAVQWSGAGTGYLAAQEIVRWVNANGGEARYEPNGWKEIVQVHYEPRIAVRTVNDWAYAAQGDFIEMGALYHPADGKHHADEPDDMNCGHWFREFVVRDAAYFDGRTLKEQTT